MAGGDSPLFDAADFVVSDDAQPPTGPAVQPGERLVRVLPDVSGLSREFDYRCPARWAGEIAIGSLVRIDLNGRRVAGWVTAVDVDPLVGMSLAAITRLSSIGPPHEIVELARWASHRWHGRLAPILKAASPPRMVPVRPTARTMPAHGARPRTSGDALETAADWLAEAAVGIDPGRVLAATTSPTSRVGPMIARLAALGNVLVIEPDVARARWMVGRLNRAGLRAHGHPRQWAAGFTGGVVVGSRSAVWAPLPDPVAVVVLDEHDESLQEERTPTWHARDVAVERARRSGARCVLAGPILSPAALAAADEVVHAPRTEMRRGWPLVEVVDRRRDDLGFNSLFSPRLANVLRSAERAVVVLNRKGRAHLLACATCGALARSEDGRHVMTEDEGGLVAPATGERRPLVCADCGGTSLKRLRLGVSRAAEELGRLVDRPVVEIGSDRSRSDQSEKSAIVLGTEAALRALDRCDVVAFLDFDQELLAPRYRAAQQAMALLARGAELVGGRRDVSRLLVQTRVPDHPVLRAASTADPATLSRRESESRRAMGWPPFGALAEVSGDGAPAMADALAVVMSADPELARRCTLLGPRQDGRYLVSVGPGEVDAGQVLADLLAAVPRPRQRLRVVVDPPRA